jgi:Tachylectin
MKFSSFTSARMRNAKAYSVALLICCLTGFTSTAHAIQSAYAAFADGDGDIYTITNDGNLRWYQHNGRMTGLDTWADSGQAKVVYDTATTNNWANAKILSGDDGVIYTINNNGQLFWSRHDGRFTGSQTWANQGNAKLISTTDWNRFAHIISGGDGVLYAITNDGKMLWFRHLGWADGANKWAPGSGKQIGKGWDGVIKVFSGGNGVIYSIMSSGRLRWHRHDGRLTGTDNWAFTGIHRVVGYNWQSYTQVFTGGDGIIYAVKANGDVIWNHHTGWLTGMDAWAPAPKNATGRIITRGWILR